MRSASQEKLARKGAAWPTIARCLSPTSTWGHARPRRTLCSTSSRRHEADTVYLVGDIVDFWRIRRGAIWPQSHNDVLQKLLRKARKGTRVVFIPGNHDEGMRQYCGSHFGGIEIEHEIVHTTADGRRYLVIHGDEFDVVVRYAKWLAFLGDRGYELALWINTRLNFIRRRLGLGYWSLSALPEAQGQDRRQLHRRVRAVAVARRRAGAASTASSAATSTTPPSASIDDIHYLNTGDWVESCTAIVENEDGSFEIIRWLDVIAGAAA